MNRRRVLETAALCGGPVLSGCLFGTSGGPDSGDLRIENGHAADHTVTVTVRKITDNESDAYGPEYEATPASTPLWKRTDQFTVGAGEEMTEVEYLTETGAFFIRVALETGATGQGWIGLYPAGRDGEGVAEEYIEVTITAEGSVWVAPQQAGV